MNLIDEATIIRKERKTIKIAIKPSGELEIICPNKISLTYLKNILEKKEHLIRKKINETKQNNDRNKLILSYKEVSLLGKPYKIVFSDKIGKPYFTDDTLLIPDRYKDKTSFIIKKTFKELAKKIVITQVNKIIENSYLYPEKIVLGSFKEKWGSCDSLKIIKLNWKIVMLPQELINFVVYHELCHLKEMNHSIKFYSLLESFIPNHKFQRKDLKRYSFLLGLY